MNLDWVNSRWIPTLIDRGDARSRGYRRYKRLKKKWLTGKRADTQHLYAGWLENAVEIRCPLVLISQVQRSGGTLLAQLFDGHPECHAHPPELQIGYPDKAKWPELDLRDSPEKWFGMLFDPRASRAFREGYSKDLAREGERFPFLFLPSLQRETFLRLATPIRVTSQRDVFDAYMTSYFNAWLDNQNRYGRKKIITAFVSKLAAGEDSVGRFFHVYPDGRLLSIIRDPQTWYVSAYQRWDKGYGDLEYALKRWTGSAQAMMRNKERYGDSVLILRFEDLLSHTEDTMRSLASHLGIHFDNVLLTPTFNKMPIRAHSSFPVEGDGLLLDPLSRHKLLTSGERDTIDGIALGTYQQVLQHAVRVERKSPPEQE